MEKNISKDVSVPPEQPINGNEQQSISLSVWTFFNRTIFLYGETYFFLNYFIQWLQFLQVWIDGFVLDLTVCEKRDAYMIRCCAFSSQCVGIQKKYLAQSQNEFLWSLLWYTKQNIYLFLMYFKNNLVQNLLLLV